MALSFRKLTYIKKRILAGCTGRINLHLLHIRKTGGTALKFALSKHQVTPSVVFHTHPHRIRLSDIPENHRVMFVVRDPVSRFVSGFGSRFRKGAPAHNVPWTQEEEKAFSHFQDPNSLALALDPSHDMHLEALHAMRSISHVGSSYWDWFIDVEYLLRRRSSILFIGKIETFESDFEELKKRTGLPSDLVLPSGAKEANRAENGGAAVQKLEPRAIDLVRAWYRRDYEFLDFCNQWRNEQGGAVAKI